GSAHANARPWAMTYVRQVVPQTLRCAGRCRGRVQDFSLRDGRQRPWGRSGSRLRNLEHLDALVAGIGDVEAILAVEGHPMGMDELARIFARVRDAHQVFALRREALHAVVEAADPYAVALVDGDADR